MKRTKYSFTGSRPVFTGAPAIVPGGFNLDKTNQSFELGAVVPAGSLAVVDEATRTVKIVKTAKVVAIDSVDAKIVTLKVDEFFEPLFVAGESVQKVGAIGGAFANAPTITKVIRKVGSSFVIHLSAAIDGLNVNDVLEQVVSKKSAPVVAGILVTHGDADHVYVVTPGLDLAAGDKVMNYPLAEGALIANAIAVTSYDKLSGKLVLASDPTSAGVGAALVKVFANSTAAVAEADVAAEIGKASRVTITDTEVSEYETAIDVCHDTMQYALFENRVAPIPASQKDAQGEFLAANPHIRLTKALA